MRKKTRTPAVTRTIARKTVNNNFSRRLLLKNAVCHAGNDKSRHSRRSRGSLKSLIIAAREKMILNASVAITTELGFSPHGNKATIRPSRVIIPMPAPIPANILASLLSAFLQGNRRDRSAWPGKKRKKGNSRIVATMPGAR